MNSNSNEEITIYVPGGVKKKTSILPLTSIIEKEEELKNSINSHEENSFSMNRFDEKNKKKFSERFQNKNDYAQIIEENVRLKENLNELIDFSDDLKKEKDLIFEKYQELIIENKKLKRFLGESEPLDFFYKNSNEKIHNTPKINMKLSQWIKQNEHRLIDFDNSESQSSSSISFCSFSSSDKSIFYLLILKLFKI